jgi:superfamily II DNA or RNA helicase
VKLVSNVSTLIQGVDWDIRCISLCRPTKSEILLKQLVGRGLRTAPGKDECVILDHSDTTMKLGFVTDIEHYELNDGKERVNLKTRERLPKPCPKCAMLDIVILREVRDVFRASNNFIFIVVRCSRPMYWTVA